MAKIERIKGQRIIYKALRRKPKIKQQVYHPEAANRRWKENTMTKKTNNGL
jgi:hypothetical protein